VYVFTFQGNHFPAVVSEQMGKLWLVMLDISGQMETAFVVEQPGVYLADPRFIFLGKLRS
jgi:hypothetical protein